MARVPTHLRGDALLDGELVAAAHAVQPEREQADYEAWAAPAEEARRVIELARTFLAAIEELIE